MRANTTLPTRRSVIFRTAAARRALAVLGGGMLLLGVFFVAFALQSWAVPAVPARAGVVQPDSELFDLTKIWNVHFQFTAEQWAAMEPKGGTTGFGGPGGPGGPGGFGPAAALVPLFLQGNKNGDGRLAREEFTALGAKWFAAWDADHTGKLDAAKIGAGLNAALTAAGNPRPDNPAGGAAPGGAAGGRAGGPSFVAAEGRRTGMAGASGIDFAYVHADLEFGGQVMKDVAVRYKGNNTFMEARNSLKRSFKVDLKRFAPGRKFDGVTVLNLHNNITDASWMNEPLSYRLFRDAGVPAGRTAYARVYVTVPGKFAHRYFGLYSLAENPDNSFAVDRFGTKKGVIFKPVTSQLFEYMGDDWAAYSQSYDPKTPVSPEETQRVIAFAKFVSQASDPEFAARLEEFLDLDEFARFMAVTAWLSNMDSLLAMGQNLIVYLHPKTHQFQFIPWDLDHSFGQFPMAGTTEQIENLSLLHPWSGQNRFLERVFKVEQFKRLYVAQLKEFNATIFKPERFYRQVDELAAVLRPAVQEESADKLARFDKVVAGDVSGQAGGGGGGRAGGAGGGAGFGPPGGFGQASKPIKGFVTARAKSVNDQLAGKSEGALLTGRGGPGGPGGAGGAGRPGGPGGRGGFGPGAFLGAAILSALDTDKDGQVTSTEFSQGFQRWFDAWNTDRSGTLTEEQLRAGLVKDLAPARGARGGFGPPAGAGGPPASPTQP